MTAEEAKTFLIGQGFHIGIDEGLAVAKDSHKRWPRKQHTFQNSSWIKLATEVHEALCNNLTEIIKELEGEKEHTIQTITKHSQCLVMLNKIPLDREDKPENGIKAFGKTIQVPMPKRMSIISKGEIIEKILQLQVKLQSADKKPSSDERSLTMSKIAADMQEYQKVLKYMEENNKTTFIDPIS